ncbi:MAG: GNAT family N-acyltransferase [Paracoccaceae bacterium]
MPIFRKGRYSVRFAASEADLQAAQRLRWLAFRGDSGRDRADADRFDALCRHVMVEEHATRRLVCTFRIMALAGDQIAQSYSAQYYGLAGLQGYAGRMFEIGRFCIHPTVMDADVLRVAWGAMARIVEVEGIDLLFGCTSFQGVEAAAYHDAFAVLKARHLAPKRWLPAVKAPNVFRFAARLRRKPDMRAAMVKMPPLLKTYLMMGGWVSDHAVVDAEMNTLHVFTGLEIRAIPPGRARLLRALAG